MATGVRVIGVNPRTLGWAVDELLKQGCTVADALKVAAGEHLAAILFSAFIFAPPSVIDTAGGVDLRFVANEERSLPDKVLPGDSVVVEVKSVPGHFRELSGSADKAGAKALGREISAEVKAADTILQEAASWMNKMAAKLAAEAADHRYGFLIVHPFEQFAQEIMNQPLMAGVLKPLALPTPMDGLWVLWWPDQLTAWSTQEQCWYQMLFSGFGSEQELMDAGPRDLLVEAEEAFLLGTGATKGSPFLFELKVRKDT